MITGILELPGNLMSRLSKTTWLKRRTDFLSVIWGLLKSNMSFEIEFSASGPITTNYYNFISKNRCFHLRHCFWGNLERVQNCADLPGLTNLIPDGAGHDRSALFASYLQAQQYTQKNILICTTVLMRTFYWVIYIPARRTLTLNSPATCNINL